MPKKAMEEIPTGVVVLLAAVYTHDTFHVLAANLCPPGGKKKGDPKSVKRPTIVFLSLAGVNKNRTSGHKATFRKRIPPNGGEVQKIKTLFMTTRSEWGYNETIHRQWDLPEKRYA